LICPCCKNEKLEADICPNCSLGQKEALLKAADECWGQEKPDQAIEYYGKYLALQPDDFDIACKRADCLCLLTLRRRDQALFKQADHDLLQILENHWDWETGHRHRMDLYGLFDKLELLVQEYDKIHRRNPSRAESCDKIIHNIKLVSRFKNAPPLVPATPADTSEAFVLWQSFWPLLLGIAGGWAIVSGLHYLLAIKEKNTEVKSLFILVIVVFCVLTLSIWCFARYKKMKKNAGG
jgi:tetratricopeptide (TPR) repeat protein